MSTGFPTAPQVPTPQPAAAQPDTSFNFGLNAQPSPGPQRLDVASAQQLAQQWYTVQSQLEQLKLQERELRETLVDSEMFDPTKEKGTQRYALGLGYSLKIMKPQTVSVQNKNGEAFAAVAQLRNLGESSADKANRLFNFEAKLKSSVYKELTDDEKAIIDPLITYRNGTPQMSLEEPKSE